MLLAETTLRDSTTSSLRHIAEQLLVQEASILSQDILCQCVLAAPRLPLLLLLNLARAMRPVQQDHPLLGNLEEVSTHRISFWATCEDGGSGNTQSNPRGWMTPV